MYTTMTIFEVIEIKCRRCSDTFTVTKDGAFMRKDCLCDSCRAENKKLIDRYELMSRSAYSGKNKELAKFQNQIEEFWRNI